MAFQCDNESELSEDNLNESGILGKWEIANETINGISDLLPKCCKFFEFNPDNNNQDLSGLFMFIDDPVENYMGAFTIEEPKQLIIFQREGKENIEYGYSINLSKDYLTLTFTEDNSAFVQGWVKRN